MSNTIAASCKRIPYLPTANLPEKSEEKETSLLKIENNPVVTPAVNKLKDRVVLPPLELIRIWLGRPLPLFPIFPHIRAPQTLPAAKSAVDKLENTERLPSLTPPPLPTYSPGFWKMKEFMEINPGAAEGKEVPIQIKICREKLGWLYKYFIKPYEDIDPGFLRMEPDPCEIDPGFLRMSPKDFEIDSGFYR